jgi:hypothetical protein
MILSARRGDFEKNPAASGTRAREPARGGRRGLELLGRPPAQETATGGPVSG